MNAATNVSLFLKSWLNHVEECPAWPNTIPPETKGAIHLWGNLLMNAKAGLRFSTEPNLYVMGTKPRTNSIGQNKCLEGCWGGTILRNDTYSEPWSKKKCGESGIHGNEILGQSSEMVKAELCIPLLRLSSLAFQENKLLIRRKVPCLPCIPPHWGSAHL